MIKRFIDFLENPIFSLRASENLSHRSAILAWRLQQWSFITFKQQWRAGTADSSTKTRMDVYIHGDMALNYTRISTCNGKTRQSNLLMQVAVNARRAACVRDHKPVIFASHHTFLLLPLVPIVTCCWPSSRRRSQGWDKTWFCLAAAFWLCIDTQ